MFAKLVIAQHGNPEIAACGERWPAAHGHRSRRRKQAAAGARKDEAAVDIPAPWRGILVHGNSSSFALAHCRCEYAQ